MISNQVQRLGVKRLLEFGINALMPNPVNASPLPSNKDIINIESRKIIYETL